MENSNGTNGFQYTYSAKEQDEIKRIREKYAIQSEHSGEDKMERLRRLDEGVTKKAQAIAITIGVIGTLILGFGMSLIMTDLGEILGPLQDFSMGIGVAVGVLGGVLASVAYPIYHTILKRERKRIAPEILKLTEELMK